MEISRIFLKICNKLFIFIALVIALAISIAALMYRYYILLINIRDKNKRTILGNMYLDSMNNSITIIENANTISFI